MRRALIVAVVAGLVAGAMAGPVEAKKKKRNPMRIERTVEARYENPTPFMSLTMPPASLCVGCPTFTTTQDEVYAMIEIDDDVSPVGIIDFAWDSDGDGVYESLERVCGQTGAGSPVKIPGGTQFIAVPSAFPTFWCIGSSIAGTIKVTFSNLP